MKLLDEALLESLLNQMTIKLNVVGPFMENGIRGNVYASLNIIH